MKTASHWKRKCLARKRWSLNATAKRGRLRIERANNPQFDLPRSVAKPRIPAADLKINIQCVGYGRIQFSAHYFHGRLFGVGFTLSPKQLGRRIGEMVDLWLKFPN